jgi:beta-phosphoglucomutase
MLNIAACIFDLDGVLVDTAKYHFIAWRNLAKQWDIELTHEENEKLKGVGRVDSLKHILALGNVELNEDEISHWCAQKNEEYLGFVSSMNENELLPKVVDLLEELQDKNIKIGLGSASRNAPLIIEKTGIKQYFKAVVSGNDVKNSKPHPEVFLNGAEILGVKPSETIVFEDSQKGIQAAISGGFYSVGIGKQIDLNKADLVIPSFENHTFKNIHDLLSDLIK